MTKLEHLTLNERVYQRIRDSVLNGTAPPHARLDEQSLAKEMGVSRTPIREAIGKLTKEGLVEYRPYQGNFVRSFTPQQVNNLYRVRVALEALAVRLAVPHLTDAQVEEFRVILDVGQDALDQGDLIGYGTADHRFHGMIAAYSGNDTLVESLDRLGLQIQVVRTAANHDPVLVRETAHQREEIVAAFRARDAVAAEQLLTEHIDAVRRSMVAQIEATERNSAEPENNGHLVVKRENASVPVM